ncbi:hypothetical protein MBLNU457_g0495t1 [Dothideomycetes sp. NU457]
MSDEDKPKRVSIPSWQQKGANDDGKSAASDKDAAPKATIVGTVQLETSKNEDGAEEKAQEHEKQIVGTEDEILEQVRTFLAQDAVKAAPMEKKRAFLESKGVSQKIIDMALSESGRATETTQNVTISPSEFKASQQQATSGPQIQRDVPPVVTYPEFLVQPQKPPPLVTINRLLNTAYVTGALGTVFYGLSKYIIDPMKDNLTEARHDFAEHVLEHTNKLNDKLSSVASTVPSIAKAKPDISARDNDVDSVVSDPTELFHRDYGTQTEAVLERPSSPDSSDDEISATAKSTIEKQEERLKTMTSHFKEVLSSIKADQGGAESIQGRVTDLREYLDVMIYPHLAQIENGSWQYAPTADRKKDDGVAALRAEIRSVKGVLLSAKRFPPSVGPAVRAGG